MCRWSLDGERAALLALFFGGAPVATILCAPATSVLCYSGLDGGWPSVFYFNGALNLLWAALFHHFTASSPDLHPR